MKFNNREDIIQLTPLWKGERFEDGRPKVPDDTIARLRELNIVLEEAWAVCWSHGYHYQFEGNWLNLHPEQIVIGRAVTGTFVPQRPDLHDYLMSYGHQVEGRIGAMNSWVIETLRQDDVIVIDLFGKVVFGTFSGANLSTAIATRTGGTAQIIDGGIRDTQQILAIPDFNTFCRGMDPTPIRDVTLVGLNTPCRIGSATCMPGDLVVATYEGVLFVPPHLAEEVLEHVERTHLREEFSHQRLREGIYTSSEMDTKWTPAIDEDFDNWRQERGLGEISFDGKSATDQSQADEETLL